MNYSAANMNRIMDNLQKIRLDNMLTLQARKKQIYEEIPEIRDIDLQMASASLDVAKKRILDPGNAEKYSVDEIKKSNLLLSQKKKKLLSENGYPGDYLDEIFNCPKCRDYGYVNNKPCTCLEEYIIKDLYRQSNLDNILKRENFDTFCLGLYSKNKIEGQSYSPYDNMSNIVKHAKEYIADFDKKSESILIYGETGLGKTFLTNCIAKELLDAGHTVLYLSSNELFENILVKYIMSDKSNTELGSMYNFIYSCELLIIDDLGTEFTNNMQLSQFFELINKRAAEGLSTIISTNLTLPQIKERYTDRIVSRIIEGYRIFYVYGANIRYQKRKALMNKSNDII